MSLKKIRIRIKLKGCDLKSEDIQFTVTEKHNLSRFASNHVIFVKQATSLSEISKSVLLQGLICLNELERFFSFLFGLVLIFPLKKIIF